jgi:hypothetical protein
MHEVGYSALWPRGEKGQMLTSGVNLIVQGGSGRLRILCIGCCDRVMEKLR